MREIICPACGETERLSGTRTDDGIMITCAACDTTWPRDSVPERCATCGGTDLDTRPQAMTQYSRGTQLSIVGWQHTPLCATCDAETLERVQAGRPVPSHYISAAVKPRTDPGETTDHRILPR